MANPPAHRSRISTRRAALLRVVLLALATGLLATCSESPISPSRGGLGVLRLAPVFPSSAQTAGLALDNVQLVVVRLPSTTLLDQNYPFRTDQTQLTIAESILLEAESERLQVTLTCLSGSAPLFSGTGIVEVRQGAGSGDPVEVPLAFVGPGNQVASISLAPRDTVLTFDASMALRVTAADAQGQGVAQFYVSWQSNAPNQVPNGAGILRAGRARMVLRITAATPSQARDSTTVTIVPPATRLSRTAGDEQSAAAGTRLPQPLEVEVRGDDDLPIPGVSVAFAAPGGGSVDNPTTTTDATGRARTGATLGPTPGSQSFAATVTGAGSVTFTATATSVAAPPTVSFTAPTQSASEAVGTATITAQLSGASTQTVTVPFTVSGTAASPADYGISASPLTIPAGATTATITVTIAADGVAEPDETVIVTLGTPTNAVLGTTTVHTLTINGQTPTVSFTAPTQSVGEGAGTATITAQLSSASSLAVTVPFTVSGTAANPADYTITASPLVIAAGNTTATITVTLVADGVAEPNETVVVTMGTPVNAILGATTVHTLTIASQIPTVSFTAATQTVGEGVAATITARLSIPSTQTVTVPYTVGGTASNPADYTIAASPLVIVAGNSTGTITVTTATDSLAEPDETVVVSMGTPTNATAAAPTVHTLTIAAQLPTVFFTAAGNSESENVGTATISLRLSLIPTQTVSVPFTLGGTATSPADYSLNDASPIVFPAGFTTGTISIRVVDDPTAEPDETVVVTLGTPTGATLGTPSAHTLTIRNNDQGLTVNLSGGGSGTVATPPGFSPVINCSTGGPPAQCAAAYPSGTQVSLTATPQPTSEGIFRFEGWSSTGTGFTCTTSPTCVVVMDQSRQVTARFSTWGTITFVPPSASFIMQERAAPPAAIDLSVRNTGERQLVLNGTIPIVYAPQVTPWLDAKLDRLVVDTLTPAALRLTVLPAATGLVAGTYQANVTVRDEGLQRSWSLIVTLTITQGHPPVLSNIGYTQPSPINTCDIFGGPLGTAFLVRYDYTDAGGDVRAGANILVNYLFSNGGSGSFDEGPFSSIGGNGFSGTIQSDMCFLFGAASFVDVTITVTDLAGFAGQPIVVRILRPAGANSVGDPRLVGFKGASLPTSQSPR